MTANWKSGCGAVELQVGAPNHPYLIDFGSNCHNRVRITQDKEVAIKKEKGTWKEGDKPEFTKFGDHGGYELYNVFANRVKILKGADKIGIFRAQTGGEPWGTGFDHKDALTNYYCKGCGTLICHIPQGHPTLIEMHAQRVDGWTQDMSNAVYFGGKDGPQPKGEAPSCPNGCCDCGWTCCFFGLRASCCGAVCYEPCYEKCGIPLRAPHPCCLLCPCMFCAPACFYPAEDIFNVTKIKRGVKEYMGRQVEYISDPKFLKWNSSEEKVAAGAAVGGTVAKPVASFTR